jgi:anti-sigma B factor antagonist/stage II sporulation protein AA (anti-sigma F factor antagonist)
MTMQVSEQRYDNALLLKVSGRLDRDTADEFKATLLPHVEKCRPGGEVLLLDFSDLEYISSLGFQVLLLAQQKAKTQSGSFGIAALQPGVKSVLDVANFARVIRCHENVEKGLAAMSHSAHTAYLQAR